MTTPLSIEISDLVGPERERGVPVIVDSFVGIYRWHAKRTLRQVSRVRAATVGGETVGVSLLERIAPAVGYVYYLAVRQAYRRQGVGARLLDDALALFAQGGARVVYAAAEEDNESSLALFRSRKFRTVERRETGYADGGLGAWGLRSRMWIVSGEVLLGLRLAPEPVARAPPAAP